MPLRGRKSGFRRGFLDRLSEGNLLQHLSIFGSGGSDKVGNSLSRYAGTPPIGSVQDRFTCKLHFCPGIVVPTCRED